jgi:hypothetical protein
MEFFSHFELRFIFLVRFAQKLKPPCKQIVLPGLVKMNRFTIGLQEILIPRLNMAIPRPASERMCT